PKLRATDHAAAAAGNAAEPARLQKLAEAAFAQSRAAPAPMRAPAKKVANSRAGDAGWEEF
ncbi:MAG: hypothetical protein K2Z25_21965, partial [Beijerinckiaceae bacterium]|nr:hypothetical protein [Beijerinckiaceae bacterium]